MRLPYGHGSLELPLEPEDFSAILEPHTAGNPQVWQQALPELLDSLDCRLAQQRPTSIAVLVEDHTRKNRELPALLEALIPRIACIPDRRLVVAYGTHAPHTQEEHRNAYGDAALQTFRLVNHDARDEATLVPVGILPTGQPLRVCREAAEAAFRVVIGSIEPHVFAGFTGGRKMILPGIADYEAIRTNHARVLRRFQGLGSLEENPIHAEMEAAARLLPVQFGFQFVRGARGEVLELLGGDLDACFARGAARCAQANTAFLDRPADLTLVTPGGHPKDATLYQANRAITAARLATRPGGTVVVVAAFHQGVGHPRLEAALKSSLSAILACEESQVAVGDHNAICLARNAEAVDLRFHSDWPEARLRELGLNPFCAPGESFHQAWIRQRRSLPDSAQTVLIPNGSCVIPCVANH